MDDLDFIKKHVPQKLDEGLVFKSAGDMLKGLLRGLRDEIESLDSSINHGDIEDIKFDFDDLKELYTSYIKASVR